MFLTALRKDKTPIPLVMATTINETSFRSQKKKNTSTLGLSQVCKVAKLITNWKDLCPSELTITGFTANNIGAA